ncbi:MAG: zinc dependent phospholipase C family protein [Lachnospiraceae bacterium]|nr:zinc dependent phospholipase C family protein [Lachnospiraceae bacterium]
MASWMVHLRVADQLLERCDILPMESPAFCKYSTDLDETAFVVGNIAPDSGVPTADWSAYVPDKMTSHFKTMRGAEIMAETMGRRDGKPQIDVESFVEKYFTAEQRAGYDRRQMSFYLGYLTHLLTDVLWVREIYWPAVQAEQEAYTADHMDTVWKWKKDWYDLDFLYLQQHPDFRAFDIYEAAVDFRNDLMEEFPSDAFENRRQYITWFYHQHRDGLDRHYPYLNQEQMDTFVSLAVQEITEYISKRF